jgi:molybdate transport system ATP-binding protein
MVVVHRRDRPSRGEHENPVHGTLVECLALGENTLALLRAEGSDDAIAFSVPTHVANRNGLRVGVAAAVSLLKEAIHLMPPDSGV